MKLHLVLLLLLASLLGTVVAGIHGKHKQGGVVMSKLTEGKWSGRVRISNDVTLRETPMVRPQAALVPQNGSKEKDKIVKLPGQPDVDFNQYSGYITVDKNAERTLFYYLSEATGNNQSSKPLLLWIDGDPTCSSIGLGALQQLGPFRVNGDGKTLYRNPYAWNNVANVLFVESPAGVGFSYSNNKKDYSTTGDLKSSTDLLIFLVNWVERFPEYMNRDFYVAGERFAGKLAPQLALYILKHNQSSKKKMFNMKGVMVGNPEVTWNWSGQYEFYWTHALISDEAWHQIRTYCDFLPTVNQSDNCTKALDDMTLMTESLSSRRLNLDNIYAPLCHSDRLAPKPKRPSVMRFDPCSEKYVTNYMNQPQVQEALHADVTKVNNSWDSCSKNIRVWYEIPELDTMKPLYQELMAKGIRLWFYSGDTDGLNTVTTTRAFLNDFKLPVQTPWRPWYFSDEIGGYTVVYKGDLVLATVRGVGHPVSGYQPRGAFVLAESFLLGKPLPAMH